MGSELRGDRERVAAALPGYEILRQLGSGSFGHVWAGRHHQLRRVDAIKSLKHFLVDDPTIRERFRREARVLANIEHPHIVPIYDFRQDDRACLLMMEYLSNGTVWKRFTQEGLSQETACAVAMAACAGLHHAHQQGVLHRDVKPENLLLSKKGQLKVTDFGLAKVAGGSESLATKAGEVMGTPVYMAPEQAEGGEVATTADVYSTAVVLYELLSGRLPHKDQGGALAIMIRKIEQDPIPLHDITTMVPRPLADVTMQALARAPTDRFPTAEAFGVAIAEAANSAWGSGWLSRAEISPISPGPIPSSADRSGTAFPTRVASPHHERTLKIPAVQPSPPRQPRVRPSNPDRVVAPLLRAVSSRDLVPVGRVLKTRRRRSDAFLLPLVAVITLIGVLGVAVAALSDRGSTTTLSGVPPTTLDPGPATTSSEVPPTPSTLAEPPPAAPSAPLLPVPLPPGGNAVLEPGPYTTAVFRPAFNFVLNEDWRTTSGENPDELELARFAPGSDAAQGIITFLRVERVFDPNTTFLTAVEAEAASLPVPPDLAGWLRDHPRLETSDPRPVARGGVVGQRLDVAAIDGYEYERCRGLRCVVLFQMDQFHRWLIQQEEATRLRRFSVLSVDQQTFVVIVSALEEDPEAFLVEAERLLAGLEFQR